MTHGCVDIWDSPEEKEDWKKQGKKAQLYETLRATTDRAGLSTLRNSQTMKTISHTGGKLSGNYLALKYKDHFEKSMT